MGSATRFLIEVISTIGDFGWALGGAAAVVSLFHILLHKRDPRSAAYWVALVVLVPFGGAFLYLLLGINVIRRRGKRYRKSMDRYSEGGFDGGHGGDLEGHELACALDRISRLGVVRGNRIEVLRNGEEAMPAMLQAIRNAKESVSFTTYIFETAGIGGDFVHELASAQSRGVEVRVIVDDAGTRYSWPPVTGRLREKGVRVERFMALWHLVRLATMNLRNHRKLLIVDGKTAFTGGMNIREGNMIARNPKSPVRDLHFRVEGPVVAQMQRIFVEDWAFCSNETLEGDRWFPAIPDAGSVISVGIPDGPDEDIEVMPVAFFAALSAAKHEVKILTPYFLPPPTLIWAIKLCAVRGVKVTIVNPARNNIPPVSWAARTLFPELLEAGCRVFESPEPFDHSKIFLIDGLWSFIGSTNWDPRSLRLNFEFNLACCDRELALRLDAEFEKKLGESRELTLADIQQDPLAIQLRNGIARLFIPLL